MLEALFLLHRPITAAMHVCDDPLGVLQCILNLQSTIDGAYMLIKPRNRIGQNQNFVELKGVIWHNR
jgi:hypothetical protein